MEKLLWALFWIWGLLAAGLSLVVFVLTWMLVAAIFYFVGAVLQHGGF
jgi:hypothetical protein